MLLLALFFLVACLQLKLFNTIRRTLNCACKIFAEDRCLTQNLQNIKSTAKSLSVSWPIQIRLLQQKVKNQCKKVLLARTAITLKIINQKVTVLGKARRKGNYLLLKDKTNLWI
ncbi:hypothetical protein [Mucilaginibacter arboris]|uniref:Uncharacterized protein n=1 Tax=Mucilaginibacter arboris TaxID=2682090 RepID=A0A7K1STL2_9SPHI|nr:hypothetical protein [Mucilaginibacter arboris]MVN20631.1 hypothetical protein [Mucilaginibacter arboris]